MARFERANKRQLAVIIILVVALIASNVAWIWYESQFIEEETTVTQEADWEDGNVILNGTGEVSVYGQSEADSQYEEANP